MGHGTKCLTDKKFCICSEHCIHFVSVLFARIIYFLSVETL